MIFLVPGATPEFMVVHLDADYNLMVRRKCDSITLTAKSHEPLCRGSALGRPPLITDAG